MNCFMDNKLYAMVGYWGNYDLSKFLILPRILNWKIKYFYNVFVSKWIVSDRLVHGRSESIRLVYGRSWVQIPPGTRNFFQSFLSSHIIPFHSRVYAKLSTTKYFFRISWLFQKIIETSLASRPLCVTEGGLEPRRPRRIFRPSSSGDVTFDYAPNISNISVSVL